MTKLFMPPTREEWIFLGMVLFLVVVLIVITEIVRKISDGHSETTRKSVHMITGILMAFSPFLFHSAVPVLVIASAAMVGTVLSLRYGFLKSLHNTDRVSYGTVLHPASFFILTIIFWDRAPYILTISMLVMAIPDALAAMLGKLILTPHYITLGGSRKTIEGSWVMFSSTFVLIFLSLRYFHPYSEAGALVIAASTALVVTGWEAITTKGFDNLAVPLSTAFMLNFFLFSAGHGGAHHMATAVVLALVISLVSFYFHLISKSGTVAVFLLATVIFGIGGWTWTIPILTFFVASSLLSKIGKKKKIRLKDTFDKTDRRDSGQVAANGGMAGVIILLWHLFPEWSDLYYVYVASIAAVTADTWGTEIGTMVKGKPRSIVTFQHVETGTSGGVSAAGIAGGAVGAMLVILSAWIASGYSMTLWTVFLLCLSAIAGSLIDSIAGGTIQAQYRADDGRITEKRSVNGVPTTLIRGAAWIDNDTVNWICSASGALIIYFLL